MKFVYLLSALTFFIAMIALIFFGYQPTKDFVFASFFINTLGFAAEYMRESGAK